MPRSVVFIPYSPRYSLLSYIVLSSISSPTHQRNSDIVTRPGAESAPPSVGFVSLGCPKATVDSEHIINWLQAEGYRIAPSYQGADLVVVNTCGFIESAVQESLSAIGEAIEQNGRVIVTGCLGVKAEQIRDLHPKVLAVTGPHSAAEVMHAVRTHLPRTTHPFIDLVPPRTTRLTPGHYAYLKISEGCNHKCTFCIIPDMRGPLLSRDIGEVLREAEALVAGGVRELLVISQDTSAYGVDRRYASGFWNGRPIKTRLFELAEALGSLGVWVRLHYVYPYPSVDDLMPLMSSGKILPYLDIPFQHASSRILRLMKRPASAEDNLARIQAWRKICPALRIRSTFIVGFPGETEEEFKELLDFLKEAKLDRVGCFAYSPVEGARANDLPDPIPEAIRHQRQKQLMRVQASVSRERQAQLKGQTISVMVDSVSGTEKRAVGRSEGDAPEIDGQVFFSYTGKMPRPGHIEQVRITRTTTHDLHGRMINN